MTCDGCKNAVTRVVKGIPGVDKLDVDVAAKRVVRARFDLKTLTVP